METGKTLHQVDSDHGCLFSATSYRQTESLRMNGFRQELRDSAITVRHLSKSQVNDLNNNTSTNSPQVNGFR